MTYPPTLSKNNNIIINGRILSCTVDMGMNRITSLENPIDPYDATPKFYVDAIALNSVPSIEVTLTGTSYTMLTMDTRGTFDIIVANIVPDGPTAKFTITKSGSSRNASIQRWGSCAGTNTFERLEMRWLPEMGIELRKNGPNYDGLYKVRYTSV